MDTIRLGELFLKMLTTTSKWSCLSRILFLKRVTSNNFFVDMIEIIRDSGNLPCSGKNRNSTGIYSIIAISISHSAAEKLWRPEFTLKPTEASHLVKN